MNKVILEEFFYLATLSFLPFIIHYFYSHCFVCRVKDKHKLILFYFLYFHCAVGLRLSSLPGMVQLALNAGLIVLLSFFYKGDFKWRISAALFIVALIFLSDAAMPPVYSTNGYIVTLFLSKLLMFILVFIFVRLIRSYGEWALSGRYWVLLFLCPFLSITGVTSLSKDLSLQSYPLLFPVISSGLLMINFLTFMLYDRILSIQLAQHKNRLLEQQNIYFVSQYIQMKERHEEVSKFQHDFKNILLGLKAKLQSGDEKASMEALDKLLGNMEKVTEGCNTGNIIIDSIINFKLQVAIKQGISFCLDLIIPSEIELDPLVMSVILGNALDNAIEACKSETNLEKQIKIHMHYLNQSLFIRIQNPYTNEIRTDAKGDFCSTKTGNRVYGLGLKNIKKIVNDCGGILDITYNNNRFQIEIVLFNIQLRSAVGNYRVIKSRGCKH